MHQIAAIIFVLPSTNIIIVTRFDGYQHGLSINVVGAPFCDGLGLMGDLTNLSLWAISI